MKIVFVTTGEPSGIGPDICLDVLQLDVTDYIIILIGDKDLLQNRALLLNKKINFITLTLYDIKLNRLNRLSGNSIYILHVDCPKLNCVGVPNIQNVAYVLNILDLAVTVCSFSDQALIVTAPINKYIINAAGIAFSGHTEYLAKQFAAKSVIMMLSTKKLNVALLTTHIPLADVSKTITSDRINNALVTIHEYWKNVFGIRAPTIGVCGLNPHAGEGGCIGTEERDIINPSVQRWQQAGKAVFGSFAADTIFNKQFDVILAMYHDQGLPVIKYSDFYYGVNISLGLPIIRTSVDHGTACELAGTGSADSRSLLEAIYIAIKHSNLRKTNRSSYT